jgi:DNA polymerase-1
MEKHGIFINKEQLENLQLEISEHIKELEQEIYSVAQQEFNINSPLQLREILFDKLKLEVIKKTKTGASTDNEVLEILSQRHILPKLILDYREKAKIKSTYLDGLIPLINEKTSRIYPTFNQMITATGRLSCTHPNIQNIPIKSEYGNKIRKAFTVPNGYKFVSLDYSQIELRLMAHFSEDEELLKAFQENIDVHSLTASKIYGIDISKVDNLMRRDGKTVNFAIIYGITPHGLAKSLKITRDKAKIFIENYFREYKGVKNYIETCINYAKEHGYVETLFNRRRFIRGIKSRSFQEREFAKRVAVNTPIQGTASDIIKLAMLEIDKIQKDYNASMIMQIHDELIFEVKEEYAEQFTERAKTIMENIAPMLKVPLKVDVGIGDNWFEAH